MGNWGITAYCVLIFHDVLARHNDLVWTKLVLSLHRFRYQVHPDPEISVCKKTGGVF
jgi:hypothetical protein